MPAGNEWRATRALGRAVLLVGLLVIAGVVLGRVDVVLLAAPLALGTAWSLRRRPVQPPAAAVSTDGVAVVEGGPVAGAVSVTNPGPAGLDVVVLRVAAGRWLQVRDVDRPMVLMVPPGQVAELPLTGTARRWGRHRLGPVTATAFAGDGLFAHPLAGSRWERVRVYPATEPFEAAEAMPRAAGLVGAHHSRRPGEGGELAGVRQYAPGDRLRRVDWRVSLRTRQLHVAATLSDRDAELVLVLDLLADAGRSGGVGGTASVLDTTVRAAAAVAEHYLHRGDRVSLVEYGPRARRLRTASGRRQYLTILEWLLEVQVGASAEESYELAGRAVPGHALVVVLTPLVDPRSGAMLAGLARAGRYVVAVDTLPADHPVPRTKEDGDAAYRLWRLERNNILGALREHGVPVVPWVGSGSLDQVLRDIARAAVAPRGHRAGAR